MPIEDKDILMSNSTIIAGLFIFLTISNFLPGTTEDMNRVFAVVIGSLLIMPFAVSGIMVVAGYTRAAKWILGTGFFIMVFGLSVMFIVVSNSTL